MSFTPGPWEEAATQICKSVEDRISATARRAAEAMYESIMVTTRDYLRDNVNFNLQSQLDAADRQCKSLRAEAASLAEERDKLRSTLAKIADLARPGQSVSVSQATDIICDIWNEAGFALSKAEGHIGQELEPDQSGCKGGDQ